MQGWVYVISNKAMPGLLKIGYSMQDPKLRAQELNHTGSPHPYLVEYEVLVEEPRSVEQKVHRSLTRVIEGKEWFRCTPEEAVATIQQVTRGSQINESFRGVERAKAEQFRKEREVEEQNQRELDAKIREQQQAIHTKYNQLMAQHFLEASFPVCWAGCALAALFVLAVLDARMSGMGMFLTSVIFGGIVAGFVKDYHDKRQKSSPAYQAILRDREAELEAVKSKLQFTFRQKPEPGASPDVPAGATLSAGTAYPRPHRHARENPEHSALQRQDTNVVIRTERRYCMYCRGHEVAKVMGDASVICTRCRNTL